MNVIMPTDPHRRSDILTKTRTKITIVFLDKCILMKISNLKSPDIVAKRSNIRRILRSNQCILMIMSSLKSSDRVGNRSNVRRIFRSEYNTDNDLSQNFKRCGYKKQDWDNSPIESVYKYNVSSHKFRHCG